MGNEFILYVQCSVVEDIYFFFQAEDGIRDYKVTGVQTCALPIYRQGRRAGGPGADDVQQDVGRVPARGRPAPLRGGRARRRRSEERRVGKEGRWRWWMKL